MHEMSLMADLFRKVNEVSRSAGAARVTKVVVRLGALAHISPEHFREHFVEGARGTPAEDAELEVTLDTDTAAPDAQDIVLVSLDVEDGAA
jgi:hydrogenase nickel incorporation protein HypA/HybF